MLAPSMTYQLMVRLVSAAAAGRIAVAGVKL